MTVGLLHCYWFLYCRSFFRDMTTRKGLDVFSCADWAERSGFGALHTRRCRDDDDVKDVFPCGDAEVDF